MEENPLLREVVQTIPATTFQIRNEEKVPCAAVPPPTALRGVPEDGRVVSLRDPGIWEALRQFRILSVTLDNPWGSASREASQEAGSEVQPVVIDPDSQSPPPLTFHPGCHGGMSQKTLPPSQLSMY